MTGGGCWPGGRSRERVRPTSRHAGGRTGRLFAVPMPGRGRPFAQPGSAASAGSVTRCGGGVIDRSGTLKGHRRPAGVFRSTKIFALEGCGVYAVCKHAREDSLYFTYASRHVRSHAHNVLDIHSHTQRTARAITQPTHDTPRLVHQ